jgi:hypothetical protein
MANVRCPMCSKINAPEAEECVYCRARLKPLRPTSSDLPEKPASGQTPPRSPAGDAPDWLNGLRSEAPEDALDGAAGDAENAADADLPDWLSRIRSTPDSDDAVSSLDQEPEDLPDWMRGLRPETPDDSSSNLELGNSLFDRLQDEQTRQDAVQDNATQGDLRDEEPDWLSTLGGGGAPTASEDEDWVNKLSSWQSDPVGEEEGPHGTEPSSTDSSSSPTGDDFNWLSGLNLEADSSVEPISWEKKQDATPESFGLTDFLSEQEHTEFAADNQPAAFENPEPEEKRVSSGFGITDFLSDLDQPVEKPAEDLPGWDSSIHSPAETELPDWSSEGEFSTPEVGEDGLPSWLGGLQSEQQDETPADAPSSEPGIPDWLSANADVDPQPSPPSAGDTAIPSWLGEDFAGVEPAAPRAAPEQTGLPNWLSGKEETMPTAEPPRAQSGQEQEELPDWLSASSEQDAPQETPVAPSMDAQAEIPDWLSSMDDQRQPAAGQKEAAESESLQNWMNEFAGAESETVDVPGLDESHIEHAVSAEKTPSVEKDPFIDEETPDWLREFNAVAETDDETVSPLIGLDDQMTPVVDGDLEQSFSVDLPDWLSEESAPQPVAEAEQAAEIVDEGLAQADLPEWVRDMRPIESVIVGDTLSPEMDQRVEKAGPLAGMRGVLPAEELSAHYRKPPVYSVKLRVTEKQRNQASLLESIISQEPQPLLIAPERVHSARIIPRIMVALLLLVALIIPRLLDIDPLGIPVLYPAEMLEMFEEINQTQQESSVILLAVDYEPGRAGEMQLTASAVIEHLMAQNVNLAVISTVPNGPALAYRLLTTSAQNYQEQTQETFNLDDQVVNLGYLPGGAISLLEFAQFPRRSAPADLTGDYGVWQNTFLQNITGLGDFTQIIVLTDSAETGRAWVEQVQPLMGSTPLFMITSAQASPLLVPYLESRQISGLVSGLLGGAMYARLLAQGTGPAAMYLATYQVGLLLAFVLILAGGLVSAGMALFKRDKKDEA